MRTAAFFPPSRPLRLFAALAIILLTGSLLGSFQLHQQFQRDLENRLELARRLFADLSVLRAPTEPHVNFSALEDIATKLEGSGGFSAITVSKLFSPPGVIRVVHPFYVPALHPQEGRSDAPKSTAPNAPRVNEHYLLPWALPADARTLPLIVDNETLGFLHLRVDQTALLTVRAILVSLFLLLTVALFILARQFQTQHQALSATTVELATIRRELARLERLALAGQLSANLLHDLRKPVLNIRAELEDLPLPETHPHPILREQVQLFFDILRETGFEGLLRTPGEAEYLDVQDLLRRSLALVRYERRAVEIQWRLPPQLPPILAESVRLIQVFSNLILNAYQAMKGQGTLHIELSVHPGEVHLLLQDTGPGIPPELYSKVFEPFFTTRLNQGGTGLGLYIARETLLELSATIELLPSEKGACFLIRLPAPDPEPHLAP